MEPIFHCAVNAIWNEENELNDLFNKNSKYYTNHHQGVCNLYETTFAYIIFKELLRKKLSYRVHWEFPYPGNNYEHCDLALLNEIQEHPVSLIEIKLWMSNNDQNIKEDIEKLKKVSIYEKSKNIGNCKKYILVIGFGGDLKDNTDFLNQNTDIKFIDNYTINTKYYWSDKEVIDDNNLNLFMYQINE